MADTDLNVSTLLVQDRAQVRLMALRQLLTAAQQLADDLDRTLMMGVDGLNCNHSRVLLGRAQRCVAEVRAAEEVLGQVGWKKERGE